MVANGQGNGIAWDFRRCPYIDFQGFWGCWGMCTRKTGVIAFQCIWGKCWLVRKTGLLVCRTRNTAMSLTTAARFLNIPIVDIVGRKWSSIFLQMCQLRALLPFLAHTTIQMSAEFRRCLVSQGAISQQQLEWMKTARTWDDLRYRWELQGAETGSNLAFFLQSKAIRSAEAICDWSWENWYWSPTELSELWPWPWSVDLSGTFSSVFARQTRERSWFSYTYLSTSLPPKQRPWCGTPRHTTCDTAWHGMTHGRWMQYDAMTNLWCVCLIRVGLVGLVVSSFSWQEILQVLHEHGESVVAVFAGHDHDGGVSVEPFLSISPVMSRSYVLLRAVTWGEWRAVCCWCVNVSLVCGISTGYAVDEGGWLWIFFWFKIHQFGRHISSCLS